ncbi:hypothetical protein [Pantanalinema sp. GBBB05]|uniref:hypothetical protein n=1 Tax=Pantanalinema sp. GBBB05 TaxID=2604139 RepID=UPI001DA55C37|nr:hypothetical protein [Pantanalinema sp. GBBB05]
MAIFLWLLLAWTAGIAVILGSLMTIASFLLWLVPHTAKSKSTKPLALPSVGYQRWQLIGVALAIALSGLILLIVVPFPHL